MTTDTMSGLKYGFFSVMRLTGEAITQTGTLFGDMAFQNAQGKKQGIAEQVSAAIPITFCLVFLALLRIDTSVQESMKLFLFVLATPLLICAGLYLIGAVLGGETRFGTVCTAWIYTYWATDLFLFILLISHACAALLGLTPAEMPNWLGFTFLSLYLCAGIWKLLSTVSILRVVLGLRGWRLALAMLTVLFAAAGIAIVSTLVLGTKIPII